MNRKYKYILSGLLTAHLVLLIVFASLRSVGGDEGFYLNATRMVGLGKVIYADFFYTQMMLMPTVFSTFALSGWQSFWILRGFAVMAGFMSAILVFAIVLRAVRNVKAGLIALSLYSFSGLLLSIHSLYEPLVFAHFLALATFYFWLLYRDGQKPSYLFLSGLFLSALINHRAIFIVLLPLYLWSVWSLSDTKKLRAMFLFILSLIPFSIPTVVGALLSPSNFLFDTFIFQTVREVDRSIGLIVENRVATLLRTFIDPHLLVLFILTLLSLWLLLRDGKLRNFQSLATTPEGMTAANLILIAGVYFLPHPILRHYPEQFIAFGIILIAFNIEAILKNTSRILRPERNRLLIGAIAGLYVISIVPYAAISILGVRRIDRHFLLSEIKKITSQMMMLGQPSDTVLAEWSGYTFFTGQTPLPLTEIIGFHWPLPISRDKYMKYKLCDSIYLIDAVAKRIPSLVVTVNNPAAYYTLELESGYDEAFQSDVTSIYKRR